MKNKPVDLEQEIRNSFDQIDPIKVQVPELTFFANLIEQQEKISLKKQNQQFTLFIVCAIGLISLLFFFLFAYTMVILVLQGLSITVPLLWLAFSFLNRKERVG